MLVEKHLPTHRLLHVDQCPDILTLSLLIGPIHVIAIVVVAKHREDAIASLQTSQHIDKRLQLRRVTIDDITREDHDIGLQRIDCVDHTRHKRRIRAPSATVDIAYLHHLKAVECLRQSLADHILTRHLNTCATDQCTPPYSSEAYQCQHTASDAYTPCHALHSMQNHADKRHQRIDSLRDKQRQISVKQPHHRLKVGSRITTRKQKCDRKQCPHSQSRRHPCPTSPTMTCSLDIAIYQPVDTKTEHKKRAQHYKGKSHVLSK